MNFMPKIDQRMKSMIKVGGNFICSLIIPCPDGFFNFNHQQ